MDKLDDIGRGLDILAELNLDRAQVATVAAYLDVSDGELLDALTRWFDQGIYQLSRDGLTIIAAV